MVKVTDWPPAALPGPPTSVPTLTGPAIEYATPGRFCRLVSWVKRLGSSQARLVPTTPRSTVPAGQLAAGVPGAGGGGGGGVVGGVTMTRLPSPGEATSSAPQAPSAMAVPRRKIARSLDMAGPPWPDVGGDSTDAAALGSG